MSTVVPRSGFAAVSNGRFRDENPSFFSQSNPAGAQHIQGNFLSTRPFHVTSMSTCLMSKDTRHSFHIVKTSCSFVADSKGQTMNDCRVFVWSCYQVVQIWFDHVCLPGELVGSGVAVGHFAFYCGTSCLLLRGGDAGDGKYHRSGYMWKK